MLHCCEWASHCGGFSCCRAQALGCLGFSSCDTWVYLLRGMWNLPDRGSNLCPLHWQVDSYPLHHQECPA